MELRALQPISALVPIFFEFTTNRWTIETKQQRVNSGLYWELGVDKEGGKTESRYSKEEKSWRSKEKEDRSSKEDAQEGFLDAKEEEVARSATTINESPKKRENRREGRAIEDTEERKDTRDGEEKNKENKDIKREGREEKEEEEAEEGRPRAGGPHRCGARRGQSAAA